MKRATRALLWLTGGAAAAIGGAWAWANRDRATAAALTTCRPTPTQLDAWGKTKGVAIRVTGSEGLLGSADRRGPPLIFDSGRGAIMSIQDPNAIHPMLTADLCAYVAKANLVAQVKAAL